MRPCVVRKGTMRAWGGSATLEMAILLPMYLIILFGVLYFGYATLGTQKQHLASAYAVAQPGVQAADDALPRFFPWHGAVEQSGPGQIGRAPNVRIGTEARAGDGTVRLGEWRDTDNELLTVRHITESLGGIAVGSWHDQIVWTPTGLVIQRSRSGNDRANYLAGNLISDPNAPLAQTPYSAWVNQTLRGESGGTPWLERRVARVEYVYQPFFFGHVIGPGQIDPGTGQPAVRPLTHAEYFGQFPLPDAPPVFWGGQRVAVRTGVERLAAGDPGCDSARLLTEMTALVGQGAALADPMTEADRDAIGQLYWPDNPNIWERR